MNNLQKLESKSIYILREAYYHISNLGMLWSAGKDSTVLVHLCRKAFFGHVPFPLIHIDTGFKMPEMIAFRDQLALAWGLTMIYSQNRQALHDKKTFPDKTISCLECCKKLKTEVLQQVVQGKATQFRLNHTTAQYELDRTPEPLGGLIIGIRADEEGSRSKERYFSVRDKNNDWNYESQLPEFWGHFNTEFSPGSHIRVHPLLDWREIDIWQYIKREQIPISSLYFNKGDGTRFRSLGCIPCTRPIYSAASNIDEIVEELQSGELANTGERSGRAQDQEDRGGLETLRKGGYM